MWDYRIFVDVTMQVALQRAMHRDLPLFGTPEAVRASYLERYFPGQQLYFQAVQPQQHARNIPNSSCHLMSYFSRSFLLSFFIHSLLPIAPKANDSAPSLPGEVLLRSGTQPVLSAHDTRVHFAHPLPPLATLQ